MAIIKNTASQGLYVYAHDTAADAAKTGDAAQITATLSLDGAAAVATNDTNPTEIGSGVYWFALTQAETNAGALALIPVSSTANVVLDPVLVLTQEVALDSRASQASLDVVDEIVDTILVDTGTDIPASIAALPTDADVQTAAAAALAAYDAPTNAELDALLDATIEDPLTLRQTLRILLAALAGKSTGGGTTALTFRDLADSKARITAMVDANHNRTAITLDAT